jgi:hypothetical protein
MLKYMTLLLGSCILVISLMASCQQPATVPAQPSSPPAQSATTPSTNQADSGKKGQWISDGIISAGEYAKTGSYDNFQLSWSNDDSFIYAGIKAKTTGWVAVGFGAESLMKNADIIQGYVADGKAVVMDTFSTGQFGPHPPDTELGGTNDIIETSAKIDNAYITVEFKRKLDTGDKYDKPLVKGTNKIIWAFSSEPKATLKHTARGHGEIDIQ